VKLDPRPHRVFCDTSFFYACLDHADVNHDAAAELASWAAKNGIDFYSTWDVVSETSTLLLMRCGYKIAIAFLDEIKPSLNIITYDESIRDQAESIFKKFSRDKFLSYCDAISFTVVTLLLNNIPCLSFDKDFRNLGLTVLRSPI